MGATNFPPGLSIVIPAYYICAGITLFAALQFAAIGLLGEKKPLYLAFSILCLSSAGFIFTSALYYSASSVSIAAADLQWQIFFFCIFFPAFLGFIALYTGQRQIKPWLLALMALSLLFAIVNFEMPYSLRFTTLEMANPLHFPWGETLSRFSGEFSRWNSFARIVVLGIITWAIWRTVQQYFAGNRRSAKFLGASILLFLLSMIEGFLVDLGYVDFVYTAGFAYMSVVLLMSIGLGHEINDRNIELETTATGLKREIEKRVMAENHIRDMAYRDYLTGLASRALLDEYLTGVMQQAEEKGCKGLVLLIDLDHFKTINDALGHEVGDLVLREVARRLDSEVAGNAFVARMGGDEFIIVLQDDAPEEEITVMRGHLAAEKVMASLVRPIVLGERVLNIGASIGAALFPQQDCTAMDILRCVDMALYRAKALGRNNIQFFMPSMQVYADNRLQLEKGLRLALANNELSLNFQPKVHSSGRVVGAEVLLRWVHPEMGRISPSAFIPVAEETGMIHAIGGWVLEQACDCLAKWNDDGIPFDGRLSVNVSAWQFSHPDFVTGLRHTMLTRNVDPHRLMLEITESALSYNILETISRLNELRSMGIQTSLDDFGTGYSSLSHLQELPLDELKIDQSFVKRLTGDASTALIDAIISVGQRTGLKVVAEGVETDAQLRVLERSGCHIFQGNRFSRPLPEKDFVVWLTNEPVKSLVGVV